VIGRFRFAWLLLALALSSLHSLVPAQAHAQDPEQEAEEEEEVDREPQRVSGAITTGPARERLRLAPPFAKDRAGDITTRALFPFFFERKGPTLLERFIVPQYYRRSPELDANVTLGLVWSLRGPNRNTVIVGPVYGHRRDKDWGAALVPLFSAGSYAGHSHLVIPPLLTWFDSTEKRHRRVVALYYDVQKKDARWRGLAPLVWAKHGDAGGFTVLPPLYWRFEQADPLENTTVVPPFYHVRTKDTSRWALVPVLWHKQTPELRATTIPLALFHHARGPNEFRLVTPLLAYLSDKKANTKLWITPLYQRGRGDKNFDAVAPLFIRTWDDRDMSRGLYLPPIYWHWEDPANRYTTVLPLFLRNVRDGISDTWLTPLVGRKRSHEQDAQTWWFAPTFHWGWQPDSWFANLHPLAYVGRDKEADHTVVLPLYYDFHNKKEDARRTAVFPFWWDFRVAKSKKHNRVLFPLYYHTKNDEKQREYKIGFPIYWDLNFRDRQERYTVTFPFHGRGILGDRTRHYVLNTMYEPAHGVDRGWQFHFFPLLARGGSKTGKWWSFLYGLAGYERRGAYRRMQLFWIPFELKKAAPTAVTDTRTPERTRTRWPAPAL
jgi:hypothetical protein